MNKPTFLLTIDWLELVLKGRIHELTDVRVSRDGFDGISIKKDIELVRIQKGGHVNYKYAFLIIYKAKEYGVLYYGNTVSIDKIQLKVNNNQLYSSGYISRLKTIIKLLGLSFIGYQQIDIALDGLEVIDKIDRLLRSHRYEFASTVQPRNGPDLKTKKWKSLLFGSIKGKKILSVYNKSKEIQDQVKKGRNNKQYILDYWKVNNLNSERVERVELRLFSSNLKQFGENLDWLKDTGFLFNIFKTECEGWLKFKNKLTKKYTPIINWNSIEIKAEITPVAVDDSLSDHVAVMRQAVKALTIDSHKTFDDNLMDAMITITHHYGLTEWVKDNLKKWKYLSRKAALIAAKKARKDYYKSKEYLSSIRNRKRL